MESPLPGPGAQPSSGRLLAGAAVAAAGLGVAVVVGHGPLPLLATAVAGVGVLGARFVVAVQARRRFELDVPADARGLLRHLGRRDAYTAAHCTRTARIAVAVAEELGRLSSRRLEHLRLACVLHDVGKLDVPLEVLRKPAALDAREWRLMRAHVGNGLALLGRSLPAHRAAARIVEQHHERLDGSGYPAGLPASRISLEARILAVADAFDALTSDRPYRRAIDPTRACAELRRACGTKRVPRQFDAEVVEALVRRFLGAGAPADDDAPAATG